MKMIERNQQHKYVATFFRYTDTKDVDNTKDGKDEHEKDDDKYLNIHFLLIFSQHFGDSQHVDSHFFST